MSASNLRGQLPRVLSATFLVVSIPLLTVKAAEALTGLESPLLSVAAVVALSFAVASAGAAYWARSPGSRDLVFGDLMLWGWIRRLRTERRLAETGRRLGLGRSGTSVLDTDLSPDQQADLLERLASSLEARDPHTHGHTQRVTRHAEMIAQGMGLSDEQVARVRTAAALHDVGKIEIPREILNKPDKLTDEEFDVIKRHPVAGAEMVAGLGDAEMTAAVRHHHERLDGRGYPDGLSGGDIPLGARIIAVADTFDAVTSSRPYRSALRHRKAIEILRAEIGSQLDPGAVAAFLAYYSGSLSASRWTFLVTAPNRIAAGLREAFQTTAAAPIAKNAAAVAVTAVLGTSLAAPIANAVQTDRPAHAASAEAAPSETAEAAVGPQTASSADSAGILERTARNARGRAGAGSPSQAAVPGGPDAILDPDGSPGDGNGPGNAQGKDNSKDRGPGSAPGRPASPGRSGAAPGHAGKPAKPDKPAKPAKEDKPAPPGHQNDAASPPASSPADSPSNQGNGNGKKK